MIEHLESRIAPATFVVTTLADTGEGSLREAIDQANDSPGADVIRFAKNLTGVIQVQNGAMQISGPLNLIGPGASKVTLDAGGGSNLFQVNDGNGATDSPATISGLSFRGAEADGGLGEVGGAIVSVESLNIKGCLFGSNRADEGGAILVQQMAGVPISVQIRNSDFIQNIAMVGGGSAVSIAVDGSVTLKGNLFDRNQSAFGSAGTGTVKVRVGEGQQVLMQKCQFIGNSAPSIGGADLRQDAGDETRVIVRDCLFLGNHATNQSTGALHVSGGAKILIERSTFLRNTAEGSAGAVAADGIESLVIRASRFEGNIAQDGQNGQGGGGLHLTISDEGAAQILSSIFKGNEGASGGGILIDDNPGKLLIAGCVIDGNIAGSEGGGISANLENTELFDLVKNKIVNNVTDGVGGGVAVSGDGPISIRANIIAHNEANLGGGVHVGLGSGAAVVVGSTIAQNMANVGGGILSQRPLEVRLSNLNGNSAQMKGGGIAANDDLTVSGCTFFRNYAINGSAIAHEGADPFEIKKSKIAGNPSVLGDEVLDE